LLEPKDTKRESVEWFAIHRAVMTEHPERIKALHTSVQRQCVKKELVISSPCAGGPCPVMKALPDVRGRFAKFANSTRLFGQVLPGEGAPIGPLFSPRSGSYGSRQGEVASHPQFGCGRAEHDVSSLEVVSIVEVSAS
jgi:hypothetical protein